MEGLQVVELFFKVLVRDFSPALREKHSGKNKDLFFLLFDVPSEFLLSILKALQRICI